MRSLRVLFCAAASGVFPYALLAADFAVPVQAFQITPRDQAADRAAELARASTGGRVVSVRPAYENPATEYEVRILLDDGLVRRVVIDPKSGKIE